MMGTWGWGLCPVSTLGHWSPHSLSLRTAYLLPPLLGLTFLPKQHNAGRNEMTPLEASLPPSCPHTPGLEDLT